MSDGGKPVSGWLIAWDPVTQKERWRIPRETFMHGGVMATAGNLVFQGTPAGKFGAYEARNGKLLWEFDAQAGILAAPISYSAGGTQHVTVVTGIGGGSGYQGPMFAKYGIDYRTQSRRVLTFAIGGRATLPTKTRYTPVAFEDPDYKPDPALAGTGGVVFGGRCTPCHGIGAIAAGTAPDLRTSPIAANFDALKNVVQGGTLLRNGMPRYDELTDDDLRSLHQYLRDRADALRSERQDELAGFNGSM